jgi:hypothetical protein
VHVITNVDNMKDLNRPKIFGNLDLGFNYDINNNLYKQCNKKLLNGFRDTLDTLEIISFDQNGCFDTRSIK